MVVDKELDGGYPLKGGVGTSLTPPGTRVPGRIVLLSTGVPMTKQDIVEDIALRTGLTKKEVAEAVELFLKSVGTALAEGKHLEIRGFGTFKVKQRKARMARNPRTGEAVPVPERRVPVFKVSKMLKDRVALT